MSEVKPDLTWYPPQFPEKGRLPSHAAITGQNCKKQDSQEIAYHDEQCLAANLHIVWRAVYMRVSSHSCYRPDTRQAVFQ